MSRDRSQRKSNLTKQYNQEKKAMDKVVVGMFAATAHMKRCTVSGAMCLIVVGLSVMAGCSNGANEDVSLPANPRSSSAPPPPKVGSVKDGSPSLAQLEATLAKVRADPKMDEGKRSMAIGMLEGQIKAKKSQPKP
jgi:hypothetical protein